MKILYRRPGRSWSSLGLYGLHPMMLVSLPPPHDPRYPSEILLDARYFAIVE